MDFSEKYVIESDKADPKQKDKKVISDDAFVLAELLELLIKRIERLIK